MTAFDTLESDLYAPPLFYVELHGKATGDPAKWSEGYRQTAFVTWMRKKAPGIVIASIANERRVGTNEGKRLKRQGLTPGMPDIIILFDGGLAFIEFKGFNAAGQPGKLSQAQIDTCNRIHANGHPVACFYSAESAWLWLQSVGCPLPDLDAIANAQPTGIVGGRRVFGSTAP